MALLAAYPSESLTSLHICNDHQVGLMVCCKDKNIVECYTVITKQHPIKANPVKAGDAKPWI